MHAFAHIQFRRVIVAAVLVVAGCATSAPQDEQAAARQAAAGDDEPLQRGGAECIVQDLGGTGDFQTKYCWVEYAPEAFPREARTPFINTYLEAPGFRISNPLAWGFGVGPEGSFGITMPWAYPQVGEGYVEVKPTLDEEFPGEPPEFEEDESQLGTQPAPPEPGTDATEPEP